MSAKFFTEFVILWAVIDPVGTLPVFLSVTAGMTAAAARSVAIRATFAAFLVLLFFAVAGQALLQTMEISLASFQIAGNLVLFLFALTMIFGESKSDAETSEIAKTDVDRAIYPLAIPSVAGPGAMLAAVTLTDNHKYGFVEQAVTISQIALVIFVTFLLMLLATPIIRVIGRSGSSVISRVSGIILCSLATDGVIRGIKEAFLF